VLTPVGPSSTQWKTDRSNGEWKDGDLSDVDTGRGVDAGLARSLCTLLWEIQTVEISRIYLPPSSPTFCNLCSTHSVPKPFAGVSVPLLFHDGNYIS
jgi:hypothetical protein